MSVAQFGISFLKRTLSFRKPFSMMAYDQIQLYLVAIMKDDGGIIGVTVNDSALNAGRFLAQYGHKLISVE